jgi:hypothetical protein
VLRARGGDDAVIGCAVREPVVTVCGHDARAIAARPERRVCLARGASVELDRDDTAHEQLEHVPLTDEPPALPLSCFRR